MHTVPDHAPVVRNGDSGTPDARSRTDTSMMLLARCTDGWYLAFVLASVLAGILV